MKRIEKKGGMVYLYQQCRKHHLYHPSQKSLRSNPVPLTITYRKHSLSVTANTGTSARYGDPSPYRLVRGRYEFYPHAYHYRLGFCDCRIFVRIVPRAFSDRAYRGWLVSHPAGLTHDAVPGVLASTRSVYEPPGMNFGACSYVVHLYQYR